MERISRRKSHLPIVLEYMIKKLCDDIPIAKHRSQHYGIGFKTCGFSESTFFRQQNEIMSI